MTALPLFVYGTLLAAGPRGAMLGDLARAPATTNGTLYRMPAGYPALVPYGDGTVRGELVAAPSDAVLGLVDLYEGVDTGGYRRVQIEVVQGLRKLLAWTYVMDQPERRGGRLIPSGVWRPRRAR
jgi:gamma-glutamylcyclotransferase (GGCT)/AIG2-like uncharacterized protein YtfP